MNLKFRYDFLKAENCACWMLYKLNNELTVPRLLTLAFLVDRQHLFQYYRLVFAGRYACTNYGPVPYEFWGKMNYHAMYYVSNQRFKMTGNIVSGIGKVEDKYLSESNYHSMTDILQEYGTLEEAALIKRVKSETTQLRRRAFNPTKGECQQFPIDYFFLDVEKPEVLARIAEMQTLRDAFASS